MKNIYRSILLLTIIFFANASEAQIKNQFVQPEQSYKQGVRLSKVKDLPEYELPNINVNNLLEEDSLGRLQGNPFRFGTAVNVDIDFMKSATKSSNQDTTLYFYKILSKNAFSNNLIF